MFRFTSRTVHNAWEPEPINMGEIMLKSKNILHAPEQDICIILDRDKYIELVLMNDYVKSFFYRFIIASDYSWSYEEEYRFGELVRCEKPAFDYVDLYYLYEKYSSKHTDWQLQYSKKEPLMLLDHIYSCLHRNSVKETLYKAGLNEIAINIDDVEEYNLIGSSPSDILSGLTVRTLRAINSIDGIELLKESWKRDVLYLLQQRYSWIFRRNLTPMLCRFLDFLIMHEEDIEDIAHKFNYHYKTVEHMRSDEVYSEFEFMLSKGEQIKKIFGKNIFKERTMIYIREIYFYMIENRAEWNEKIMSSNKKRNMDYEYEDDEFTAFYPTNIKEYVMEAENQSNCLLGYLDNFVRNKTDIMLLRRSNEKNQSLVTMEIEDNRIVQARARFNETPSEEIQQWIDNYARKVGLVLDRKLFVHE